MEGKVDTLLRWLQTSDQFYLTARVSVHESSNSGRGIVLAKNKLEINDTIVSVPATHQLNFNSALYHISIFNTKLNVPGVTITDRTAGEARHDKKDPRFKAYDVLQKDFLLSLSSFQLLTLYILAEWILLPQWSDNALESYWKPFFEVWPSKQELQSIPTIWNLSLEQKNKDLIQFLPYTSKRHMIRISCSVKSDWDAILPILQRWDSMFNLDKKKGLSLEKLYQEFLHVYFVINSRCLYTEIPLKKDQTPSNFTMVPYVDFINHTDKVDVHCHPKLVQASSDIKKLGPFEIHCGKHKYVNKGEEILLNYGAHSNDFLLNEYGFTLEQNKWNFVDISEELINMIKDRDEVVSFLKSNGYYGDYTISFEEISYRVIVGLSLIVTLDFRRVEKLLLGYVSEEFFLPKIKPALQKLLHSLLEKYKEKLKLLENLALSNDDAVCTSDILNIYSGYINIIENNIRNL